MQVLLTGATGLIGWRVLQRMPVDWDIFVTVHRNAEFPLPGRHVTRVPVDLRDTRAVERVVASVRPEVIVHTASLGDLDESERRPSEAWQLNVEATRALLRASDPWEPRIVLCSTIYVFDGEQAPYGEEDRPRPVNHYGATKLAAEEIARERAERLLLLRLTTAYGWHLQGQRANWATWLVRNLGEGQRVRAVDDVCTNYVWAEDVAQGIVNGIQSRVADTVHVGGPESLSRYEFSRRIALGFGYDPELIQRISSDQLPGLACRPRDTECSTRKLIDRLRVSPRPIASALETMREQKEERDRLLAAVGAALTL